MSYPKKIVKLRPTGGIVNDIPPAEVADEFYTQGNNVHFRSGFVERTIGHTPVYGTPLAEVRGLLNFRRDTSNFWIYPGIDSLNVISGTDHYDITPSGGLTTITPPNKWSMGTLNGVPFMNNGNDAPVYWAFDPMTETQELPDWPDGTSCRAMRAYKYYLIAMNIDSAAGLFPDQLLWSNSAEPGAVPSSWTPLATNDAGDTILSETPGYIVDGVPMRSSFVVFKQHAAHIMDWVGGNEVFTFRKLFTNSGMLSLNCGTDVNGRLFVVTDGDIILTDGNTTESIIDNRMRNYLFSQLDQNNFESTFVVQNRQKNEVWVCYPSAGNTFADMALVWDSVANAWGVRELPQVSCGAIGLVSPVDTDDWNSDSQQWDLDTTIWNEQLFSLQGDTMVLGQPNDVTPSESNLLQIDLGFDFDGDSIDAFVGKYSMAFDEPNRVKGVRRIIPHVVANNGVELSVRIGTQMVSEGDITWQSPKTFIVGTTQYLNFDCQGKFISIEFSSQGGLPWKLTGFDVEAEVRGYY